MPARQKSHTDVSSGAVAAPTRALDASPSSSLPLIARAQAGDEEAIDLLIARYMPRLHRWASGRLPPWARDLAETQDLVQETLNSVFRGLGRFEVRGSGALYGYLRQSLLNRIRSEIRRVKRRPTSEPLTADFVDDSPSPLERAIGREAMNRYEQALERLRPLDREAIVGRIELGLGYGELAEALDKPSANAARMAVERALLRLARELKPEGLGHE